MSEELDMGVGRWQQAYKGLQSSLLSSFSCTARLAVHASRRMQATHLHCGCPAGIVVYPHHLQGISHQPAAGVSHLQQAH